MDKSDLSPQLKADVLKFVRNQSVDGRIRAMILDLVNQALRVQAVQLSNVEKDALAHEIMKNILLEMLGEYQDAFNQN
jgi:hypothetical protein